MNILIFTRYSRNGASSRVRFYNYIPFLEEKGIKCKIIPFFSEKYLEKKYAGEKYNFVYLIFAYIKRIILLPIIRKYDLIWIEYELLPWFPPVFEWILHLFNKPFVVDYDDAIFHKYDMSDNYFIRKLLGKKIDKIMSFATSVVAGNNYIFDRASKNNPNNVFIIPTVIDIDKYKIQVYKKEQFVIGWIGSPSTVTYLEQLSDVISELSKEINVKVIIIGVGKSSIIGDFVEYLQWTEDTEIEKIQLFDIGIMPLTDDPWARGKCGYKLIQYMACGIPVIASPVGVNNNIVENGINGFLVSTIEDWINAIKILYQNDNDVISRMGLAGRKKVEEQYCIQITVNKLFSIFQDTFRTS